MKNKLFILLVFFSFLIISCKNERPKAKANFKFVYLENGGISLKHTGIGLFSTWVVDNKDTIARFDKNPVYYFKENGLHKVRLIVYDEDQYLMGSNAVSEYDSQEQTVEISGVPKKVKMEYLKIIEVPFYDKYGDAWDYDGSGPDIKFSLYYYNENNQSVGLYSPQYDNVSRADLPIEWPLNVLSVLNGENDYRIIQVTENTNSKFAHTLNTYDTYLRANGYPSVATFTNPYSYDFRYKYEIGFSYYK